MSSPRHAMGDWALTTSCRCVTCKLVVWQTKVHAKLAKSRCIKCIYIYLYKHIYTGIIYIDILYVDKQISIWIRWVYIKLHNEYDHGYIHKYIYIYIWTEKTTIKIFSFYQIHIYICHMQHVNAYRKGHTAAFRQVLMMKPRRHAKHATCTFTCSFQSICFPIQKMAEQMSWIIRII